MSSSPTAASLSQAIVFDRSTGPERCGSWSRQRRRPPVGAEANLVLIDPSERWTVHEDGFRSRSVNSWLVGEKLTGRVRMTVAAGRVAFEA